MRQRHYDEQREENCFGLGTWGGSSPVLPAPATMAWSASHTSPLPPQPAPQITFSVRKGDTPQKSVVDSQAVEVADGASMMDNGKGAPRRGGRSKTSKK